MRPVFTLTLLIVTTLGGCAHRRAADRAADARSPSPPAPLEGPRRATLPMYRVMPGADKIYVEAEVGDGVPRMWLLDTGASISVVTAEVADAAGLTVSPNRGEIVGMGGSTPWRHASIPSLDLGPFEVHDIDVAVDVPGVPDHGGLVPLAGILGNNVWGQFSLSIDYPANLLELARPGQLAVPETAQPMHFNGDHLRTGAIIEIDQAKVREWGLEPPATLGAVTQAVLLEIDTGAHSLVIAGGSGAGLEAWASEGEEPIFGVGAGEDVPPIGFMRRTRRVPIASVSAGGMRVEAPVTATWINYDERGVDLGPAGMPGLLGESVLGGYRVVLDYAGQRFALVPSTAEPEFRDIHQWALDRTRAERTPEGIIARAELLTWLDRVDEAKRLLEKRLGSAPDDSRATVLMARLDRADGDPEGAAGRLRALSPAALDQSGELVAAVNALSLDGQGAAALDLARRAVQALPTSGRAWVALSDAFRATGDFDGARHALREANRLDENPDGNLLRRAWIASLEGDENATVTQLRRRLQIYPSDPLSLWFYTAQAASDPELRALFERDLLASGARVHPADARLDYLAAAWRSLGNVDRARGLTDAGIARDCGPMEDPPARANCEAWYAAMAGTNLDAAVALIDGALVARPHRAEFLDTQAMVFEARGELAAAREAARRAALMAPDNVYYLWQADRLGAFPDGSGDGSQGG